MDLDDFLKLFGKKIKKLRIDNDISQEALSEKADMHVTFLSRIENGKTNVSIGSILKLADALEIEIQDLITFK